MVLVICNLDSLMPFILVCLCILSYGKALKYEVFTVKWDSSGILGLLFISRISIFLPSQIRPCIIVWKVTLRIPAGSSPRKNFHTPCCRSGWTALVPLLDKRITKWRCEGEQESVPIAASICVRACDRIILCVLICIYVSLSVVTCVSVCLCM